MDFNSFLQHSCDRIADKNIFSILTIDPLTNDPKIESITGNLFLKNVTQISLNYQLSNLSLKKVLFISENTIDLLIGFFASLKLSCQSCIADNKLTLHEMNQIIENFNPDFIIAEEGKIEFCKKLESIKSHQTILINLNEVKTIPSELGKLTSSSSIIETQPQVIVYTSGTSGTPKGVVLDISSIIFEAQSLQTSFERDYSKRKCFSILPLNHIYGMTTGIFVSLWTDQEIFLTQSLAPQHLKIILQDQKPTYLYVVPQFLVLIKNKITNGISQKSYGIQKLVYFILFINKYLKSKTLANIFFKEIRNQIGSSIDFIISGGAPLREDIFDFFEALGIPICNGYGLSETAPVIAMNTLKFRKRGSVGKTIQGVKVKIDSSSGELLISGPNIFKGYYENDSLTKESFDSNGWFKTGDLGYIDKDNFIFINGRSKSLIVLESGKKIQPEEVESHYSKLDFVKNCCLLYRKDKVSGINKLSLVVEIDKSIPTKTNANYNEILIQHAEALASFKKPQLFKISQNPLPITTTLKVRRFLIEKNFDTI